MSPQIDLFWDMVMRFGDYESWNMQTVVQAEITTCWWSLLPKYYEYGHESNIGSITFLNRLKTQRISDIYKNGSQTFFVVRKESDWEVSCWQKRINKAKISGYFNSKMHTSLDQKWLNVVVQLGRAMLACAKFCVCLVLTFGPNMNTKVLKKLSD